MHVAHVEVRRPERRRQVVCGKGLLVSTGATGGRRGWGAGGLLCRQDREEQRSGPRWRKGVVWGCRRTEGEVVERVEVEDRRDRGVGGLDAAQRGQLIALLAAAGGAGDGRGLAAVGDAAGPARALPLLDDDDALLRQRGDVGSRARGHRAAAEVARGDGGQARVDGRDRGGARGEQGGQQWRRQQRP